MANFDDQVMGLTGLTISGSSTAPSQSELSTFLNDGVIDVTNKVIMFRPQDREFFIRESSTTASNGLDIGGASIISVIREAGEDGDTDGSTAWRSCRKISAAMQSRVVDVSSLHFASKYNPVYAIDDNGVVNVYPIPDGTNDGFRAYYINNVPAEADGTALIHSSSGIKYFPKDKVYLVVLYSSIKSLQSALSAVDISTFSLAPVPPDVPSLDDITFSGPSSNLDASAPTFSVNNTLAGAGIYGTTSNFNDYFEDTDLNPLDDSDPGAFTLNAVPPDVPTIDEVSYFPVDGDVVVTSIVFPTDSAPAYDFTQAVTDIGSISITAVPPDVPTSPEFTLGSISSVPSLTSADTFATYLGTSPLGHTVSDPDVFVLNAVPPDVPSITTVDYSNASNSDASATSVSTSTATAPGLINVSASAPSYTPPVVGGEEEELTTTMVALAGDELGTDTDFLDFSKWFTALGEMIEDSEDVELAQAQIGKISTYMQSYAQAVQNQLNVFNQENVIYQTEFQEEVTKANQDLQVAIANANNLAQEYRQEAQQATQIDQFNKSQDQALNLANAAKSMEENISDNNSILQKFQAEIQAYQAEVGSEAQEYTQKLGRYTQEVNLTLQAWQKQESDKISSFQAEVAKYNADLQVQVQKAKLEQSDEYVQELSKFQAEVQEYQVEVTTEVQEYGQNLQKYNQEIQKELTNSLNEFNQENANFQAKVQEAVQNAQITNQAALKNIDVDLQDAIQTVQGVIANNSNVLQKFQNEVAQYQAEVGSEVQEYTQKLARYQNELNTVYQAWTQEQQAAIQESITELQADNQKNIAQGQAELQVAITNKDRELQRNLQDAVNDMKVLFDNNAQAIQKFQSEVAEYQAEVAGEIQEYQQEVAEKSAEYQWQTARLQDLKQEYNQAFALMAPAQPPQQQQAPRRRARA